MSLIITTSAIINKLMTKPNMFPPKIICNINHGIIITRYIILCKIIRYKFYRFTIVFLWSSPYKKAIASLVRYKNCTYNTKKSPTVVICTPFTGCPVKGVHIIVREFYIIGYQRYTYQGRRPRSGWGSLPRKWQAQRATTYLAVHNQRQRRLALHQSYSELMYNQGCSSNQRARW